MKKIAFLLVIGLCVLALPVRAQTSLLHEFAGGVDDGAEPYGSLIISGTTLYGMTKSGGHEYNYGTIFKIETNGTYTLLHQFNWTDGANPYGSLVISISGTTLYGLTKNGGTSGMGTIFKMETNGGGFSLLHSFAGGAADGSYPTGSLIISGTTLYGMTGWGGDNDKGTIFKIETNGSGFTLLHEFAGGAADGEEPDESLIISGSTLYGTTWYGGGYNLGTVFKIETDGSGFALLHTFAGGDDDGKYPRGSLKLSDSTLYGMTIYGGSGSDRGTIFKIGVSGSGFSLLHKFLGGADDGAYPYGSLILYGQTLYGMTSYGGSYSGTIFRIKTNGSGFALGHEFLGGAADGSSPQGSLVLSGSTLYGLTASGGDYSLGVIFSLPVFSLISGTLTMGGSPVSGVVMSGLPGSPATDASGAYTGTVTYGWNGTVTPTLAGHIFSPANRVYTNVTANQTAQDYTAMWITFTISGTILVDSAPLAGVVMSGLPGDPTTNASGFYTATVNYNWSGTVTPTLAGYAFSPVNRAYANVAADQTAQDFTATEVHALHLDSPNGAEHWDLGTNRNITWTTTNYAGTVRLVLFKGGTRLGNIATGLSAGAGSYSWTVGQYIGGTASAGSDYRLYLRSTDNALVDASDYQFSLAVPVQLQVTSPNGGESWQSGSQHAITWNANGFSGTVRLILFRNAAKIGQIEIGIPASQGSYLWTVGSHSNGTAPAGILYSIRLLAADGSQDDFSDGPFAITTGDALVADHLHAELTGIPAEWLEQTRLRQRLLVMSAMPNDPVVLGLRLLGRRGPLLGVATGNESYGNVMRLQEAVCQAKEVTDFDLSEWRWNLEKAILESDATVAVVGADEAAIRSGRLNAEGYISVLQELSERLTGVTLVCSTISMDEPNGPIERFNRTLREHALQGKGALLDTADIESWHGEEQALQGDVPVRHTAYRDAQGIYGEENVSRQGAAMWWLLARLTGWNN